MNYAVIVADDGKSAMIRIEAIESWWFEDEFNNVSASLIETQQWVLEDGRPKIVGITKEHNNYDTFYLQRRKKGHLYSSN